MKWYIFSSNGNLVLGELGHDELALDFCNSTISSSGTPLPVEQFYKHAIIQKKNWSSQSSQNSSAAPNFDSPIIKENGLFYRHTDRARDFYCARCCSILSALFASFLTDFLILLLCISSILHSGGLSSLLKQFPIYYAGQFYNRFYESYL